MKSFRVRSQPLIVITVTITILLGSAAVFASPVRPTPRSAAHAPGQVDTALATLTSSPDDDPLFDRVTELLRRNGQLRRAARTAQERVDPERPNTGYIAARLASAVGDDAAALLWLDAIARHPERPRGTDRRLLELLVRARWWDRARAVASRIDRDALSPGERAWIAFRVESNVDALLNAAAVPLEDRVRWARDAGRPDVAAELWERNGDSRRAVAAWLRAGATDRARTLVDTARSGARPLPLDDESALLLSRLTGDAQYVEAQARGRDDEAAARLIDRWQASRGSNDSATPVDTDPPSNTGTTDGGTSDASSTGPNDVDREPANSPGRTLDDDIFAALESTGPDQLARLQKLVAMKRVDPAPRLSIVAALLALDRREAARLEFARWSLRPDPVEATRWRPQLERRVPEWFAAEFSVDGVVGQCEAWPDGPKPTRASIDRALAEVDPGSRQEAMLLAQRWRLYDRPEDLQRAVRIDPRAPVAERVDGVRRVRSARYCIDPDALTTITPPESPFTPIGRSTADEGRSIYWPVYPAVHLDLPADLRVGEWRERRPTDATVDAPRPPLAIAPVGHVLRTSDGWLFVGRGLAEVDPNGALRWLVEWSHDLDLAELPTWFRQHPAIASVVPLALRTSLQWLARDPRQFVAESPQLSDALTQIRRRFDRPDELPLSIHIAAHAIWLITDGGVAVQLVEGTQPTPEPQLTIASTDVTSNCPTPSAPFPTKWVRLSTTPRPRPSRDDPEILPYLGALSADGGLSGHGAIVTSAARSDALVVVHGDGTVVASIVDPAAPETAPTVRWRTRLPTPLPGPRGFARSGIRGRSATDGRGPHLSTLVADAAHPRVFIDGPDVALVAGDVWIVRDAWTATPRIVPCRVAHTHSIRDAARTADGRWFFVNDDGQLERTNGDIVPLDRHGSALVNAFDVHAIGDELFVLGFSEASRTYWLYHVDSTDGSNRLSSLAPLPPLRYDDDRSGLRLSVLSSWGETLLLLDEDLWTISTTDEDATWRRTIEWSGRDARRSFYYQQTRPVVCGDRLIIPRPWGAVELWVPTP